MTLANVTFMTGSVREGEHVVQKNDANPAGGIPLPSPTNGAGSVGPTSGVLRTKSTPKVPPTVKKPRLIVSGSAVADGTTTSTAAQPISRARIARLTHTGFDMHTSLRWRAVQLVGPTPNTCRKLVILGVRHPSPRHAGMRRPCGR